MIQSTKVFISYAWESDKFKQNIAILAAWLEKESNGKIKVTSDHLYSNRSPNVGWPTWMANQIEDNDIVLIVCSEAYHKRFRKKEEKNKGRGVTYEGCIITQELINVQTVNDKYFPIIPDGGNIEDIPTILQQYFNGHCFPSGNEGILKLILNENPTYDQIIKPFFDAVSIDPSAKESLVDDIRDKINAEIVKEILDQFNLPLVKKERNMLSPLQHTVRAFLGLNEFEKLTIIKGLGIDLSDLNHNNLIERDKQIFKIINEKHLLSSLWVALNEIKSFGTNNPFIK